MFFLCLSLIRIRFIAFRQMATSKSFFLSYLRMIFEKLIDYSVGCIRSEIYALFFTLLCWGVYVSLCRYSGGAERKCLCFLSFFSQKLRLKGLVSCAFENSLHPAAHFSCSTRTGSAKITDTVSPPEYPPLFVSAGKLRPHSLYNTSANFPKGFQ